VNNQSILSAGSQPCLANPLDHPYVFKMRPLLTIDDFLKQCEQRGLHFHASSRGRRQLEALHRVGVLYPLYRVRKDIRATKAEALKCGQTVDDLLRSTRTAGYLSEYQAAGLVCRPRNERFRPWKSHYRISDLGLVWTSEFLFSPYQLLLVPVLKRYLEHLHARSRNASVFDATFSLRVPKFFDYSAHQIERITDLIPILSILEPRYMPEIPDRTRIVASGISLNDWATFRDQFDPIATYEQLGWPPERLREEATVLLCRARELDPITKWHELVNLVSRDRLADLQGNALVAYEHRLAAEILLRFYEDLAAASLTKPLVEGSIYRNPTDDRLRTDRIELDSVLMNFGISPHLSLVLALEGPTEMTIIPRVMRLLEMDCSPSFIRLFNYGGVGKAFELLVLYISTPFLGKPRKTHQHEFYPLDRPGTKFMQVADPEHKFATEDARKKLREGHVKAIFNALPTHLQTDAARDQLNDMVEIVSWGSDASFEFANFTDEEIVAALAVPAQTEVATQRQAGKLDRKAIWSAMRDQGVQLPSPEPPTKPELADRMWPSLERRIIEAREAGTMMDIPVVRVAVQAFNAAAINRRANVALFPFLEPKPPVSVAGSPTAADRS
jgi:hypothetical protein